MRHCITRFIESQYSLLQQRISNRSLTLIVTKLTELFSVNLTKNTLLQHYHKGCCSPRPLSGVFIEHCIDVMPLLFLFLFFFWKKNTLWILNIYVTQELTLSMFWLSACSYTPFDLCFGHILSHFWSHEFDLVTYGIIHQRFIHLSC